MPKGILVSLLSIGIVLAQEQLVEKVEKKETRPIITEPMSEVTILRLENLQLRMEILKRDLQDVASNTCTSAGMIKETCRINSASGTISGEKIVVTPKKD